MSSDQVFGSIIAGGIVAVMVLAVSCNYQDTMVMREAVRKGLVQKEVVTCKEQKIEKVWTK